jgi:hypothetical protein
VSSRNRRLTQVTVVNGIYRKATYGEIQGDYEGLELCRQLYAYVTSTSPPVCDLGYFDRLIFVAQNVHGTQIASQKCMLSVRVITGKNTLPFRSFILFSFLYVITFFSGLLRLHLSSGGYTLSYHHRDPSFPGDFK